MATSDESAVSTAQAVEKAIRLAQEAVQMDESGQVEEAITLYTTSIDLIKLGLKVQKEQEKVDTTVLQKYMKLYSDRCEELQRSIVDTPDVSEASLIGSASGASSSTVGGFGGSSGAPSGFFSFEESEMKAARPPDPPPSGADEWRRPFWLMRILRNSIEHGGYLSPDGRVYVPRRLWLQKGARFTAMAAKLECAHCLYAELHRMRAIDFKQPAIMSKEMDKLVETLDALQASLHRVLPFVPEPRNGAPETANALLKLTDRLKGGLKLIDKTAARLGALPAKCNDPNEYMSALSSVMEAAAPLETWIAHYAKVDSSLGPSIFEKLHRASVFMYEVVCAFVIQDLDGLIQRHMRKASVAFLKGVE